MNGAPQGAGHVDALPSGLLANLSVQTLFDTSPEGIWIHQDGIVVYSNQSMARMLGYDNPRDIVGKEILSFTPE